MANLVRNFIKGRMNKSVDERLVPNGEYIDARNIRMGSTEDSEIGAVENTKGNTQLTSLVYPPTGDALSADATCIGSYADGANETIYWFVHDPNFTAVGATGKLDLIVSLETRTETLTYHVVSIDDGGNVNTTLNFDPQYLVTGVDLVEDLLFFTDDKNPPRRINVTKAYEQPSAPTHEDSSFLEEDILVIKRPPTEAPTVVTSMVESDQNNYMEDRFICFAYRYRYEDDEYSATSQFSAPAFVSKPFNFTPESFLNDGMENAINTCQVTVNTGSALVKGIDILFKEMDDSIIRVIEKVDKDNAALTNGSDYTITFNKSKIFTILPESEILRLYDNVPRLAKAQTMMGNRLVYGNYLEGYDFVNENDQPIKFGYRVNHIKRPAQPTVASTAITTGTTYNIAPTGPSPATTVVVTFEEFNLTEGDTFTLQIDMGSTNAYLPIDPNAPTSGTPDATIEVSYTLTEHFDTVADMVASSSFLSAVGTAGTIETDPLLFPSSDQTIWTNAWNARIQQEATGGTPDPMPLNGSGIDALDEPAEITASTADSFTIAFPMPEFEGGATDFYEQLRITSVAILIDESKDFQYSLHSNRSYEIGIIYMDDFGRSSTVLVNEGNDFSVNCGDSIFRNYAQVQIPPLMGAPYWASRYKFAIKADAEGYETIYTNIVKDFEGHSYFLLEGENAAKVEEGDRYIVKADASGPTTTCTYATVLEKKSYEADDLGTGSLPGTYMKILPEFNATQSSLNDLFLGEQSAGTNSGSDQSVDVATGDHPLLRYTGFDTDAIPAGSRISLTMNFSRQGRGDASCETRTLDFEATWTADQAYTDIIDWFYGQSNVIADIEAAVGYSGDPAVAAPTNNVAAETTNPPDNITNDYGLTVNALVNQMCFHRDPAAAPGEEITFIIIGTNKCSGFTGGNSPNRRSRVKARWTIVRASDTFVFETEPTDALPDVWYESDESFPIVTILGNRQYRGNVQDQTSTQPAIIDTSFFNCIAYGNGVESYKFRDSITGKPILLGNRVTTTSAQDYKEVRRFADLTYSGVYNDETNVNKLNEFNLGLLNFKPLEESYGTVEKLFGRRTDILTLQEDKISYVLAGKNLLTDSTGESVVSSVPQVLGTQVARIEDYGISHNPESFAEWGPHKFFTDAKRGAVIHLFGDGTNEQLTVISEQGMRSWFRDEFIEGFNTQKLGGYDPYMDEYVLASNDVLLPGEVECLECGTTQTFLLTSAGESYCVNLGQEVGTATVNYEVLTATSPDSAVITASYDGTDTTSGSITEGSTGSFTIDKDEVGVTTSDISISYTGSRRFVVQVTVQCPQAASVAVTLVTFSRPAKQNETIHNQYQWTDGVFISPLSSKPVQFGYGAVAPVISQWEEFIAKEGSNLVPSSGSDLKLISNRIFPDNYTFQPADQFHVLRTTRKYFESDGADILDDPDIITVPYTGAQPEYSSDFTMPSTGSYLYLIWNYTDITPPTPILDLYSDAVAAYSVRKLSSTYSGPALRVRRDAPPYDEQDIGFVAGELDTASMATFAAGDVLTVSAWYDQSGASNDATQVTPTSQKQIYNGTAVWTLNGKPFMRGGTEFNTPLTSIPQPYTVSYVHASSNIFAVHLPVSVNQIRRISNADFRWLNVNVGAGVTTVNGNQTYFFGFGDGASGFGKVANSSGQPASVSVTTVQNLELARLFTFRADPQELIVWGVDHGAAQATIEQDANDYYSIY